MYYRRSHLGLKVNDPSVASFLKISRLLHVVITDCRKLKYGIGTMWSVCSNV